MAGHDLVNHIHQATAHENPHEREMPLHAASQPSAQTDRFRRNVEVVLRNLRSEAGESAEYLKATGNENQQSNGIGPMCEANDPGMLIGGRRPRILNAISGSRGCHGYKPPY